MKKEWTELQNRIARWIAPVFALVLSAMLPARDARAAGLLIADGGFGGVLEIEEQAVDVTINNGIAVTQVDQTFRNTESRQVEALYTFPVPKGASVSNFSMWINDKEMIGEVLEKKRARQIYDSYKQQKRDPGLLEQVDYKTFEMRIYPINPGATQHVRITYYQELDFDNDWATYVYPLATVTRKDIQAKTKGRFAMTLNVKSEVPIAEIGSPSHKGDFVIAKRAEDFAQASLEAAGGDLSRDVVLAFRVARPRTGLDLIANKNGNEDGYLGLTLTVGQELAQMKRGMDYVFVVDISGSMAGDGKLDLSRRAVEAFVRSLGAEDRFEIMTFNVNPGFLFQKLAPADDATKNQAAAFLGEQRAAGGTMLRPALTAAYKYADPAKPLNVVFLSDGMSEQGERTELLRLIKERPAGVKVFCIGVGNEVNRPLLTQMAEDAGGLAAFVSQGDDFERQAQGFRRKLTHPVATDLKIEFAGGDVYDLEPKTLPNLYHGMPVRLYGRYKMAGPVKVIMRATVEGKPLETAAELTLPAGDDTNPEIERMWAWHKMDRLLAEADRSGSRDAVVNEIVRLGEAYSIASEYTSFLVLENDAEFKRWQIEQRNALRVERDRRKQEQVRAGLEKLNEKALASLGPVPAAAPAKPATGNPAAPMSDTAPMKTIGPVEAAPEVLYEANPNAAPQAPVNAAQPQGQMPVRRTRGADLNLPVGGGAFDPISGGIALGLGAMAWAARRRKGSAKKDPENINRENQDRENQGRRIER